jgi:hypothetical protein
MNVGHAPRHLEAEQDLLFGRESTSDRNGAKERRFLDHHGSHLAGQGALFSLSCLVVGP